MHLLRFDFAALAKDFDLYGQHEAATWTLVLVPRTDQLRRSVGRITAAGEAATIRQIEIRRTPKQAIKIAIEAPQPPVAFTAEELKQFFR